MKALIFYHTKEAFHREPERFFTDANETVKMLNETGLKNFVQVDSYENPKAVSKQDFAEEIFMRYNQDTNPLGTKEGQQKLRSIGAGHTSMSVNDFVVIDGDVLIVDSFAFKNIGHHDAVSEVVVE